MLAFAVLPRRRQGQQSAWLQTLNKTRLNDGKGRRRVSEDRERQAVAVHQETLGIPGVERPKWVDKTHWLDVTRSNERLFETQQRKNLNRDRRSETALLDKPLHGNAR